MNDPLPTFLGTGWSFPPAFDRMSNTVQLVSDIADVEESIRIILNTLPGERVMQPEFGCHIRQLLFENIDAMFVNELNDVIRYALLKFEPRIRFLRAEVVQHYPLEGIVHLQVQFTLIITNTRHNIVYPFYFLEGTNIASNP